MAAKARAAEVALKTARNMPAKRAAGRGAARLGWRSAKLRGRSAKRSPAFQAVMGDERVRGHLVAALAAAQAIYERASRSDKRAEELIDDRRTRRELKRAIASLRAARAVVRQAKVKERRRLGFSGLAGLAVAGAAGALALNETLRARVLSVVRGGGEDADRASAASAPPAPAPRDSEPRVEPSAEASP